MAEKGYLYESGIEVKFRIAPRRGLDLARQIHEKGVRALTEAIEAAGGTEVTLEKSRLWADDSNYARRREETQDVV